MRRLLREFRAEVSKLEGRLLLAVALDPPSTPPPTVQFENTVSSESSYFPVQVVAQNAGEATLTLSRSDTVGTLQVEVTTAPHNGIWGGNIVGVNVPAVNQTVTFANGQSQATATVPIIAGAPNPGEVDVSLAISPISPSTAQINQFPLDLRIVESNPTLPPKVVSAIDDTHEIVVSFNKPMNPVAASNVINYPVSLAFVQTSSLSGFFPRSSISLKSVPLQSARYDPTTQSTTLTFKRPLGILFGTSVAQVHSVTRSVRRRDQLGVAEGITDLQGNPINASKTPGKVELRIDNISTIVA